MPNAAIRNLIREDKLHQIYSQMQIGQAKFGMQTMNQSLCEPVPRASMITLEEAIGTLERARRAQDDDRSTAAARSAAAPGRPPRQRER